MTDFEDRLRAAMTSAVADEQPPDNMVGRLRRRHQRRTARVTVAGIAVGTAAVVAVPLSRTALPAGGTRPHTVSPAPAALAHGAQPAAAGQHYGCGAQTFGALGPRWRQGSAQAGPAWFINSGISPDFRFHNSNGTLKAVPLIVLVRDNFTISVTPSGSATRSFRFLPGFSGSNEYTLHDGRSEATFTGCPARKSLYGGGFTEFYIGVIVAGPRCLTLDTRTPANKRLVPVRLTFGRCGTDT
jgi:hypothetical protein